MRRNMTDHNSNNNQSSKAGFGHQGAHEDPDTIPEEDTLCCCPPTCSPSWLQCLANPKVFTFHMMVTTSFAMMSFVYIGAVLTTIERNFQLDSAQSGAITIAADVVSTLFVMPLSHYGQLGHRPRWIGTGMLVTAVGTMLCAMPHFASDPIDPNIILTGSVDENQDLCSADDEDLYKYDTSTNASLFHDTGDVNDHGSMKGDLRKVWWIILGQLISGIGNAPFVALVVTYIDDSVKKHNLTAYTAVLFMAFTFGPSCGFLFAAFTTSLYVDFDRVPSDQIPAISQNDPRWIGAWWLGFVILSIILVFLSIPIFFYPRTMASAVKKWKEEKRKAEAEEGNKLNGTSSLAVNADDEEEDNDLRERRSSIYAHLDGGNAVETVIKGPLLALKRLFCNPTNMCLVVYETAFISLIAIFAAFGVKYTETQFSLSPSQAALITAIVLGPSNIISNIFSAYICRRFKLNSKQCCLFVLVCAAVGFILYPVGMLLGCDNVPIAGVTTSYDGVMDQSFEPLISNGCNMNCSCSDEIFQPVCGSNGLTYISPCHAGCTKDVSLLNMTTSMPNPLFMQHEYGECSCITNSSMNSESKMNVLGSSESDDVEASSGQCPDSSCQGAIPISILLCAIFFLQSAASNPRTYIALRCVREEDRSMAIALRSVSAHFLGFFPAPIFFGAIINSVCIHWQITDGERGSCWVYDNKRYRIAYFSSAMALQGIALISIICMYFCIKEKLLNKKRKDINRYDNLESRDMALDVETAS